MPTYLGEVKFWIQTPKLVYQRDRLRPITPFVLQTSSKVEGDWNIYIYIYNGLKPLYVFDLLTFSLIFNIYIGKVDKFNTYNGFNPLYIYIYIYIYIFE